MRVVRTVALALVACAFLTPWARPAHAVPVFSRAYKVPCTTCHVQFPRLNDFGMAFKQRGYRMPEQEGQAVWAKDDLPLAAMTSITYERLDAGSAGTSGTVDRRSLDFFSAGSVGPKIAYFLDYGFDQAEFDTVGGDSGTVTTTVPGGTFLVFSDLVPDSRLNLKAGVMDNDFMYLSSPRRTTMADYLAPASVDHTGIELNGVAGALRYAAGFGNDEMVGVGGVTNNLRAGYGWATYGVAGQTLGARFIGGKAGDSTATEGTHTQWDVNADLHGGPLNLILAYYAQDRVGGASGDKQTNWLAEAVYPAMSRLLLTARYEDQETKVGGTSVPGSDTLAVLNASYYLLANINIQAEVSSLDQEEAGTKEDRVIVGFTAGL
jgi:hypothetical protein